MDNPVELDGGPRALQPGKAAPRRRNKKRHGLSNRYLLLFHHGSLTVRPISNARSAVPRKGISVGSPEKNDKLIILLPPKDAESLPADVLDKMEEEVTVTGKEYQSGGLTFLTVGSIK
jgi:hypothetical protein